jgi:hypothetical protein
VSGGVLRPQQRARRHGVVLEPAARRSLEREGWRTTLDYRENHVRGLDGRLLRVDPVWTAVAERYGDELTVATAEAGSADEAWLRLCDDVANARVTTHQRVRVASATRVAAGSGRRL